MGSFMAVVLIVLAWSPANVGGVPDEYAIYPAHNLAECEKMRESYNVSRNIADADEPPPLRYTWTAECEKKLAGTTYSG